MSGRFYPPHDGSVLKLRLPLTITYPLGVEGDLINVRDAEDDCIFGDAANPPGSLGRSNWNEMVRHANESKALEEFKASAEMLEKFVVAIMPQLRNVSCDVGLLNDSLIRLAKAQAALREVRK